jgi:hypothetical protein
VAHFAADFASLVAVVTVELEVAGGSTGAALLALVAVGSDISLSISVTNQGY